MAVSQRVVHVDDVAGAEGGDGKRFRYRRRQLGAAAGGRQLGCSLFELAPGRRAFPYHWHCANEEAIFVLSGQGRLRLAGREHALAPGDYVACVTGEQGAHQVINDSDAPLLMLVVSTMLEPEVVVQPDSDKIGAIVGSPPGGDKAHRSLFAFWRRADAGEPSPWEE